MKSVLPTLLGPKVGPGPSICPVHDNFVVRSGQKDFNVLLGRHLKTYQIILK